jgi:hypothetical protein
MRLTAGLLSTMKMEEGIEISGFVGCFEASRGGILCQEIRR